VRRRDAALVQQLRHNHRHRVAAARLLIKGGVVGGHDAGRGMGCYGARLLSLVGSEAHALPPLALVSLPQRLGAGGGVRRKESSLYDTSI
jgi:hypothetical protein